MSDEETKPEGKGSSAMDAPASVTAGAKPETPGDLMLAKLIGLGVPLNVIDKIVSTLGAEKMEDLAGLTVEMLTGVDVGMKPLKATALLKALAPLAPITSAPEVKPVATAAPFATVANFDILPVVPDDASWLAALKVGGMLKFNRDTVVGTVSAALANRVGLYELPKRIVEAMETFAESLEEPVPSDFFDMQRMLTEHNYAEVFAAIPGATGRYATQARKTALLAKLDQNLWSSLTSFHGLLSNWLDAWQKGMSNPAMMMGAIASLAGGGGMMPPGMMAPPPTDGLRDAAEGVIEGINKIFAGTGILVATALAYDAQQIRKALENPSLPSHIGAVNRDQMLKQLRVSVGSDYPRLEQNLKRYALGVIELPNVSAGQTELLYITALYQLGSAIMWDKLGLDSLPTTKRPTGIGRTLRCSVADSSLVY